MPAHCEIHLRLFRADFSMLGLGDKHFRIVTELGDVLEVCHGEANPRGEDWRERLDASSVVYVGSHGNGPDHGHGAFASDGERSLHAETDEHGTYLVPADRGVIDQAALALVQEFAEFRNFVAVKLGLCSCCEVSPDKCQSSER
jgi:hypothetical protein